MGLTESVYHTFGIPAPLVSGNSPNKNEFKLNMITPAISDPKNLEKLKDGMTMTIDTTDLELQF